jgi:hypothetical protein
MLLNALEPEQLGDQIPNEGFPENPIADPCLPLYQLPFDFVAE